MKNARLIWKQKISLVLTNNPEFRCVICTVLHFLLWCITHFTLVLHILHYFLSQSELSNFLMYILRQVGALYHNKIYS